MNKEGRKVPIANILHMFKYIWDKAEAVDTTLMSNEDNFESTDIVCSLFLDNIKDIIKVGFYREYNLHNDELSGIKGKVDFKNSLNRMSFKNAKAFCDYNEFEINNPINQIIKTTAFRLYNLADISEFHKKELLQILLYLNQVDIISLRAKSFDISYNRNNHYVYFLILICKLIFDFTMLSEDLGIYKFMDIVDDDDRMEKVFELFVYKFYKYHLNDYKVGEQKQLKWQLNGGDRKWIPTMKVDTLVHNEDETIIIDTKYYTNFFNTINHQNDEVKKFHSHNLYQMFSYMSNVESHGTNIKGVLLYPMPYNEQQVDENYTTKIINNDRIVDANLQIKTINLSLRWNLVEQELLKVIRA